MKLPIRDQILWPLLGFLLIAIAANAVFSAWWMSNRSLQSLEARQRQIIGVLEESSFPLSMSVMEKLRRLTGDEIVVWDAAEQRVVVGTLSPQISNGQILGETIDAARDGSPQYRTLGDTTYLVRGGRIRGSPSKTLFVLTPDDTLRTVRREATWPPLAIGLATVVLSIPLTLLLASTWSRRIHSLERHVGTIASGEFGLELPRGAIDDELARLVESINSMSRQLQSMREQLIQGERTRLVAQLTAGFGHQLRNGLAGARLAVELHQSRCTSAVESSLVVACNQLALVEEEVQGLLSLGKGEPRNPTSVDLVQILDAVRRLVSLSCEHKGVNLAVAVDGTIRSFMGFPDGLRAALLNLTLNAIDATGPGGQVSLSLTSAESANVFAVEDDGPGPPAELAESLFESFVTSKPEGIGLGLTVASTVAVAHHGQLSWNRQDGRTRFTLKLPLPATTEESHSR